MSLRKLVAVAALAFGLTASASAGIILDHPDPKVRRALREAQVFLEQHTKGKIGFREQVNVRLMSRTEFKALSDQECVRGQAEIRGQLVVPAICGLVPGIDRAEGQLKSLLSGASTGSYSLEGRELRLPNDSDIDMITFVHEMQHALVDQNFDLRKIRGQARGDGDVALAVTALIEGSAKLAEATYAEWSETREPALAVPSRERLEKIRRTALGEAQNVYRGRTIADPNFTVEADMYLAYTFGLAWVANRALREAGEDWSGWYEKLFRTTDSTSSREVLELGEGEPFRVDRIELDLGRFRDRLAGMPGSALVNGKDDDRFGDLYARLLLGMPIDAQRGSRRPGTGWTGDRVIAVQSSTGDAGYSGGAAIVMAFGSEPEADDARKRFGRSLAPGEKLDRRAPRYGRVVIFRVGSMPNPLFEAVQSAVAARPLPALPPTPGLLARLVERCKEDSSQWPEIERLLPEIQGDLSDVLTTDLAGWVFLEKTTPALREPFDRQIEAGTRLASKGFRARLTPIERVGLIRLALKGLEDPEITPACQFNAVRFLAAEFENLPLKTRARAIEAADKLGPRGRELADALFQAHVRIVRGK